MIVNVCRCRTFRSIRWVLIYMCACVTTASTVVARLPLPFVMNPSNPCESGLLMRREECIRWSCRAARESPRGIRQWGGRNTGLHDSVVASACSKSGEIRLALFRKGGERLARGWAAHHATEARAFFFHALLHGTLLCQLHEPFGFDQR